MTVDVPVEVMRAMRAQDTPAQAVWLMKVYEVSETGVEQTQYTLRVANDKQSIIGPDGQTYQPFPFSVTLPSETGTEAPVLQVSVSDISLIVVDDIIRSAGTRDTIKADIHIVQRGVLLADGSGHEPITSYEGFEMINAVNTRTTLRFDLTVRGYLDAQLAKYWYGPGDFPGLF